MLKKFVRAQIGQFRKVVEGFKERVMREVFGFYSAVKMDIIDAKQNVVF